VAPDVLFRRASASLCVRTPSRSESRPVNHELLEEPAAANGNLLALVVQQSGSRPSFWQGCHRSDWMLTVLDDGIVDGTVTGDVRRALRRFACWCAIEAGADAQDALLVYATALADGRRPSRALREERQRRQGWLAAAGPDGVSRCIPVAAAALAAWYAGDEDVRVGARCAADFAIKAAVFSEAELWAPGWFDPNDRGEPWRVQWHTAAWIRAHHAEVTRTRDAKRELFARGLRMVLPSPFDPDKVRPTYA
jgi:hypothetical protein